MLKIFIMVFIFFFSYSSVFLMNSEPTFFLEDFQNMSGKKEASIKYYAELLNCFSLGEMKISDLKFYDKNTMFLVSKGLSNVYDFDDDYNLQEMYGIEILSNFKLLKPRIAIGHGSSFCFFSGEEYIFGAQHPIKYLAPHCYRLEKDTMRDLFLWNKSFYIFTHSNKILEIPFVESNFINNPKIFFNPEEFIGPYMKRIIQIGMHKRLDESLFLFQDNHEKYVITTNRITLQAKQQCLLSPSLNVPQSHYEFDRQPKKFVVHPHENIIIVLYEKHVSRRDNIGAQVVYKNGNQFAASMVKAADIICSNEWIEDAEFSPDGNFILFRYKNSPKLGVFRFDYDVLTSYINISPECLFELDEMKVLFSGFVPTEDKTIIYCVSQSGLIYFYSLKAAN